MFSFFGHVLVVLLQLLEDGQNAEAIAAVLTNNDIILILYQ